MDCLQHHFAGNKSSSEEPHESSCEFSELDLRQPKGRSHWAINEPEKMNTGFSLRSTKRLRFGLPEIDRKEEAVGIVHQPVLVQPQGERLRT